MNRRVPAILWYTLIFASNMINGFLIINQNSLMFTLRGNKIVLKSAVDRTHRMSSKDVDIMQPGEDILGKQINYPDFQSGFVAILGNANMGKSTLMNALMGEKLCIVSPKPQTTRHRILGILTEEGKYQLIFSDTPGMLSPSYKLQETMQESLRSAASDADVIVIVTDVYGEPLMDQVVMQKLGVTHRPIIIVINKVDLLPQGQRNLCNYSSLTSTQIRTRNTMTSLKQKLLQRKSKGQSATIASERQGQDEDSQKSADLDDSISMPSNETGKKKNNNDNIHLEPIKMLYVTESQFHFIQNFLSDR